MIEVGVADVPLTAQADILSLSRSSLYYTPSPPSAHEVAAKHRIDELYLEFPYYGARRMAAQLRREGQALDRKTVRTYMQEMGLIALYPGPNLSKRHSEHRVFPYFLRDVTHLHPIMGGERTSPLSAYGMAGCIWSRCWTGTRALS